MTKKASFADQSKLEGIQRGDRATVEGLYKDYFPRISTFIRQNSGSESDAKDIFQDAMVVLFKKVNSPGFELKSALYTFLYAICRNLWLKKLRNSGREGVTLEGDVEYIDENVEEEELTREAQYQLYRKKFRELGEGCQNLLRLSMAGKRMREIVSQLGMSSEQYARKRKFQCKQQLIKLIQNDPSFDELRFGAP